MPPRTCKTCNVPMRLISVDATGNTKWKCTDPLHAFNVVLARRIGQKTRRKNEQNAADRSKRKYETKKKRKNGA